MGTFSNILQNLKWPGALPGGRGDGRPWILKSSYFVAFFLFGPSQQTTKAFLPSMLEKNHGHIVTIASSASFFGTSGLCDYCASKFGAAGFDESLSMELGVLKKDGVNTTVVCPYYINTGMFDGVKSR